MPVYILVHGGRQTGKVWDKVAPLLVPTSTEDEGGEKLSH